MTQTLLIDLDNTLLRNENGVFIPALIQAFCDDMADLVDPADLPALFVQSTQAMIQNRKPDEVLLEVLSAEFSEHSGIDTDLLEDRIRSFYDRRFQSLRGLTRPIAGARRLIEEVRARGFYIAIATNPLYPSAAVRQRLEWAGLSSEWFRPDLIATFDRFHFTKPAPAYFAELLAQMGWPEGDVVMIGDDLLNDIAPARALGVPTFQIVETPDGPLPEGEPRHGCGGLNEFTQWLDRNPHGSLTPVFDQPAAFEAILQATPAAIDTLLRFSSDDSLEHRLEEEEWNITEVICHLRDVEREVQLPRIRQVLMEANPVIVGRSTDEWAAERGYCFQNPQLAFREFLDCRSESLSLLASISAEDWRRPARHTIFGPTTLLELTSIAAGHDRLHLNQAWRLERDFAGRS